MLVGSHLLALPFTYSVKFVQIDITPTVRKLERQLAVTKEALQAQNERLKELDSQVCYLVHF